MGKIIIKHKYLFLFTFFYNYCKSQPIKFSIELINFQKNCQSDLIKANEESKKILKIKKFKPFENSLLYFEIVKLNYYQNNLAEFIENYQKCTSEIKFLNEFEKTYIQLKLLSIDALKRNKNINSFMLVNDIIEPTQNIIKKYKGDHKEYIINTAKYVMAKYLIKFEPDSIEIVYKTMKELEPFFSSQKIYQDQKDEFYYTMSLLYLNCNETNFARQYASKAMHFAHTQNNKILKCDIWISNSLNSDTAYKSFFYAKDFINKNNLLLFQKPIMMNIIIGHYFNLKYQKCIEVIDEYKKYWSIQNNFPDSQTLVELYLYEHHCYASLNNKKKSLISLQNAKKYFSNRISFEVCEFYYRTLFEKYLNNNNSNEYNIYYYKFIENNLKNNELSKKENLKSLLNNILIKDYRNKDVENSMLQKNLYFIKKNNFIKKIIFVLLILIFTLSFIFIIYYLKKQNEKKISKIKENEMENIKRAEKKIRIRISEELHDRVGGSLATAKLILSKVNESSNKLELNKVKSELEIAYKKIRDLSHELYKVYPIDINFSECLTDLIFSFHEILNIKLENLNKEEFNQLNSIEQDHLLSVIEECFRNITKHSQVSEASLYLNYINNEYNILIIDNGRGFDTNKIKKGIGLKIMINKIKEIGGQISIESENHKGTTITIKLQKK